jgi:cyclophilin family peptidyl-prolyl cis-trans isomerase
VIVTQLISRVVFYRRCFRNVAACFSAAFCTVLLSAFSQPLLAANTVVRMEVSYGTSTGNIDLELFDDQAPKTVENFLHYAGRGDYTFNGFFHFVSPGQGIRAGGFTYVESSGIPIFFHIPEDPPILDEVFPPLLNTRSTIAMFKPPSDPEKMTSEWTINLTDNINSTNNVFGQVIAGMAVADAIGTVQNYVATNTHSAFISIPLVNFDNTGPILAENLVLLVRIPNIKSTSTIWGTLATFTADIDMTFGPGSVGTFNAADTALLLSTLTPPPNKTSQYIAGILTFTTTGTITPAGRTVTLLHGSTTVPNHYYAYGKTPDDPTDHWYDFMFDGTTGAEITGDRIVLHFVDGQRGDDDLAVNNSIDHTGAPALIAEPVPTGKISGCTIAATPSQTTGNGDWIFISMFLAFVTLARRRIRH